RDAFARVDDDVDRVECVARAVVVADAMNAQRRCPWLLCHSTSSVRYRPASRACRLAGSEPPSLVARDKCQPARVVPRVTDNYLGGACEGRNAPPHWTPGFRPA